MSRIADRGREIRARIRAEVRGEKNLPAPPPRPAVDSTALVLGRNHRDEVVTLARTARLQHAHVIGTVGSGKSKFLEHCIRQDIVAGLGVCVIDPHGHHSDSLFRSLLSWIGERGLRKQRPVHVIDLNADTHLIGFNPLALPSPHTAISVIADTALEAIERVWGDEDTREKPTLRRALKGTLYALTELRLTMADALRFYDPTDADGVRAWARKQVTDPTARDFLLRLERLAESPRMTDFDIEVIGPQNRFNELLSTPTIRAILGQTTQTLDFGKIFAEGHILLVNLGSVEQVQESAGDLFGRLLVRSLFFHAKRRANAQPPLFLYMDECQRYLSGDVPNLLAECRKFGLGAVLSHQFLAQLGKPDDTLRRAVLNTTNFKAVFRLRYPDDAKELAEAVLDFDYEMPVKASIRPTVTGHKKVLLTSDSKGTQRSRSTTRGVAVGETEARGVSVAVTESESVADSTSRSHSIGENVSEGASTGISHGESAALGMSTMTAMSSGSHTSGGAVMTPTDMALFPAEQVILSESAGEGLSSAESLGTGTSSMRGTSSGFSEGKSTMRGRSLSSSETQGRSITQSSSVSHAESRVHARSLVHSNSEGETIGESATTGASEAFESVYEDLPSSFHGMDKLVAMGGKVLMSLPTGAACISFVDQNRATRGLLKVPLVMPPQLDDVTFGALRSRLLDASPSTMRRDDAARAGKERERLLLTEVAKVTQWPPPEPESFREPVRRKPKPET